MENSFPKECFVKFEPKEDITAYELAKLLEFLNFIKKSQGLLLETALNRHLPIDSPLRRHFIIN